jgi:hypothetical protein
MPTCRSRSLTATASVAAVLALAACGGGGSTASAGPTTTTAPNTASTTAPTTGRRGAGGARFAAAAQAFVQCLREQGLEVGNLAAGGRPSGGAGGEFPRRPANGSRPAPPPGGSAPQGQFRRDPAVMAQRLAQRLGLNTSDESVAADVASCAPKLG